MAVIVFKSVTVTHIVLVAVFNWLVVIAPMSEGTNVTEEYTLLPLPYNVPHTLFTTILLIPPPLPPPPPEDAIVAESPFLKVTGEDPPFIVTFNPGVKIIEMLVNAAKYRASLVGTAPICVAVMLVSPAPLPTKASE
jgi:hypothetical protein